MTGRPRMMRIHGVAIALFAFTTAVAAQVVRVADTVLLSSDVYGDAARSAATIVVAVTTATELQVAVSIDGGQSWTRRPAPGPFGSHQLALQSPGIVDIVSASADGTTPPGHVRSTDLGLSWSGPNPLPLAPGSWSNQDVATSTGGVVAILGGAWPPDELWVATSSDGGANWSTSTRLASGIGFRADASLTWLSGSELLACWVEAPALRCARSTDSGATFATPVEVALATVAAGDPFWLTHKAALQAPNEVIVGMSRGSSTRFHTLDVARSTDGGTSWSPIQTLATSTHESWLFSPPSLSVGSTGEVWLASTFPYNQSRPPERSELWLSGDGIAWTPAPRLPIELSCAHAASLPEVLAGGAGEIWYRSSWAEWAVPAGMGWRTVDGAVSWDPPVDLGPTLLPTQGVRVTRLAGGRLVAMWIEGTTRPAGLRASYSDDDGFTWSSPPVAVSDVILSERDDYPTPVFEFDFNDTGAVFRYPRFDVVPLQAGGMVVLWLARGAAASCGELRATRSPDGSTFLPSTPVNDFDGFPLSISEDGAQILVSTWFLGADLVASRSTDGGATWSSPSVIVGPNPLDAAVFASEVITAADGSLGIATIRNGFPPATPFWFGDSTAEYRASSDGGLSWRMTASRTQISAIAWQPVLVNAGPRLVLAWVELNPFPSEAVEFMNLESIDSGNTFQWQQIDPWFGGVVFNRPLVTGDDVGNIFYTQPYDAVLKHAMGAASRELVGWLPKNDDISTIVEPALLATNGDLAVLFADWSTRPPAGVFYTPIPCFCRITSGPPSRLRSCNLAPVTLSVTVAGPNPSYQWHDSNGPIPGATSPDLSLTEPVIDEPYRVYVSNDCGGTFSTDALVTIAEPPSVIDAPRSAEVCLGSPFSMSVTATDPGTYRWRKNGSAISGATAATYAQPAAIAGHGGVYTVDVTNTCGNVTSPAATLTVDAQLGTLATNLYVVRDGSNLKVHWNDVATARGYEVREDVSPRGTFATIAGTALRGFPGVAIPQPVGTTYFRLVGVNACGSGVP